MRPLAPSITTAVVAATGIALAAGASAAAAAAPARPPAAQTVAPGRVYVLNTATNRVERSVAAGRAAMSAALTPDGRQLFVANYGSSTVTVVRLAGPGPATVTVRAGTAPEGVLAVPGGKLVYVAARGRRGAILTPIPTATDRPGRPVAAGAWVSALAAAPTGSMVYAVADNTATAREEVIPVHTATGRAGRPIVIGARFWNAQKALVTPDGRTLYVLSYSASPPYRGALIPVNLRTGKAGRPIGVGTTPFDMVITRDGSKLLITSARGIVPVLTARNRAMPPIADPGGSGAIILSPGGRTAYTLDGQDVLPVTVATDRAGSPIGLGPHAATGGNLAISRNGTTLYAADNVPGTPPGVIPVSTATKTAGPKIPFGTDPAIILIAPQGQTAYIIDTGP